MLGRSRPQEHRTRAVAEEGEALLVSWVDHAAVAVAADDQRALAVAGGNKLRSDHQREDKARAGGLDVERRTVELEPVLHQVGRRGKRHVRREGGEHQEVDILGVALSRLQATDRRLRAQVARGLVRKCEPPLVNPRPVDDPLRIEPEGILEVEIAHHIVGDVAPRSQNLHASQRARSRGDMDLAIAHGQYATVINRGWNHPGIAERFRHTAVSSLAQGTLASSTAICQETGVFAGLQEPFYGSLDARGTGFMNESRHVGDSGKSLTIMSSRLEDHSKGT